MKTELPKSKWIANTGELDRLTDPSDPRYAKYLRPLSTPKDEEYAVDWADITFNELSSYLLDDLDPDVEYHDPTFDPDEVYQRCLIDARRGMSDREYYISICGSDDGFGPLHH